MNNPPKNTQKKESSRWVLITILFFVFAFLSFRFIILPLGLECYIGRVQPYWCSVPETKRPLESWTKYETRLESLNQKNK